jgi:aspartate/tyrosine/aromatic aminotransferase
MDSSPTKRLKLSIEDVEAEYLQKSEAISSALANVNRRIRSFKSNSHGGALQSILKDEQRRSALRESINAAVERINENRTILTDSNSFYDQQAHA